MSADSEETKDEILKVGVMKVISKILKGKHMSESMSQIVTWFISIMSETKNLQLISEVIFFNNLV